MADTYYPRDWIGKKMRTVAAVSIFTDYWQRKPLGVAKAGSVTHAITNVFQPQTFNNANWYLEFTAPNGSKYYATFKPGLWDEKYLKAQGVKTWDEKAAAQAENESMVEQAKKEREAWDSALGGIKGILFLAVGLVAVSALQKMQ